MIKRCCLVSVARLISTFAAKWARYTRARAWGEGDVPDILRECPLPYVIVSNVLNMAETAPHGVIAMHDELRTA